VDVECLAVRTVLSMADTDELLRLSISVQDMIYTIIDDKRLGTLFFLITNMMMPRLEGHVLP